MTLNTLSTKPQPGNGKVWLMPDLNFSIRRFNVCTTFDSNDLVDICTTSNFLIWLALPHMHLTQEQIKHTARVSADLAPLHSENKTSLAHSNISLKASKTHCSEGTLQQVVVDIMSSVEMPSMSSKAEALAALPQLNAVKRE
jgi:hypothetical protein